MRSPGKARLIELVSRFEGLPIMVVGDLILDRFIWGRVERISPEAPVPVIEIVRETVHLGGAANVAANLVCLGARPAPVGVAGEDEAGDALLQELRRAGIEANGVVRESSRATTSSHSDPGPSKTDKGQVIQDGSAASFHGVKRKVPGNENTSDCYGDVGPDCDGDRSGRGG